MDSVYRRAPRDSDPAVSHSLINDKISPSGGRLNLPTARGDTGDLDQKSVSTQRTQHSVVDRWTKRGSDSPIGHQSNNAVDLSPRTNACKGTSAWRDASGRKNARSWSNRMPGDTIDSVEVPVDELETDQAVAVSALPMRTSLDVTPPRSSLSKSRQKQNESPTLKMVDQSPGNRQKRDFVRMGQKHITRTKPGLEVDKRVEDITIDSSNAVDGDTLASPVPVESLENSLSPPLSVVHQRRKRDREKG